MKIQEYKHTQSAVGKGESPIGGGDDGVGLLIHLGCIGAMGCGELSLCSCFERLAFFVGEMVLKATSRCSCYLRKLATFWVNSAMRTE